MNWEIRVDAYHMTCHVTDALMLMCILRLPPMKEPSWFFCDTNIHSQHEKAVKGTGS